MNIEKAMLARVGSPATVSLAMEVLKSLQAQVFDLERKLSILEELHATMMLTRNRELLLSSASDQVALNELFKIVDRLDERLNGCR